MFSGVGRSRKHIRISDISLAPSQYKIKRDQIGHNRTTPEILIDSEAITRTNNQLRLETIQTINMNS